MKTIISISSMLALVMLAACGNNNNSTVSADKKTDSATPITNNNTEPSKTGSVDNIVTGYLNLKNALTNDNGNEAATAAKEINAAVVNLNESALSADQKKTYDELKDDIKEHAEHISSNGSNIEHQREHFEMLSKDVIDLVKATGSSKTLFRDFCPMYNNKKGAPWLSETKEIKNPYYGKKMIKCGEVKEEIKAKA